MYETHSPHQDNLIPRYPGTGKGWPTHKAKAAYRKTQRSRKAREAQARIDREATL